MYCTNLQNVTSKIFNEKETDALRQVNEFVTVQNSHAETVSINFTQQQTIL